MMAWYWRRLNPGTISTRPASSSWWVGVSEPTERGSTGVAREVVQPARNAPTMRQPTPATTILLFIVPPPRGSTQLRHPVCVRQPWRRPSPAGTSKRRRLMFRFHLDVFQTLVSALTTAVIAELRPSLVGLQWYSMPSE